MGEDALDCARNKFARHIGEIKMFLKNALVRWWRITAHDRKSPF
jgi:hypothetical protein